MASSLLFFFLLFLFTPTLAKNVSFDSASFSFSNLTLLGDSYLRNGVIGLTKETSVPSSSAGSVICNLPIQFFDQVTNTSASFSTKFSFSITNQNPESFGDGLTFFISPNNSSLGATGGFLGIFNSTNLTNNSPIIAIEFDTRLNEEFNDTTDNHVGLDISGPLSIKTVDLGSYEVNLKSGNLTTAWIDYSNNDSRLDIWLAYTNVKPGKPIFSVTIDLSRNFAQFMYVGFSASTEGSTELHMVRDWTFQTFGFPSNLYSNVTQNSTNISVGTIPNITINSTNASSRKKIGLALGILGPVALCLAFVLFMWVTIKKLIEFTTKKDGLASEVLKGPRKFTYKELSAATRGFNMTRIIGKGAFGTVFKAVMPGTGVTYAVKRAKQEHQCKSEFVSELSIIACLRHKNLVQLEGWCDDKGELLLVYEFMPHGSLDKVLYREPNQDPGSVFNWPQRYNVAIGLASALSYLHQECEQRVIHRDIKTSNILLDVNFNPRLGDFGLARLMDHNKSPVSTLTAGTMGYLAPEYLQCGKATDQTDVFSYGVVVLEVCCGRRPIDKEDGSKKTVNLVDWVWKLYSEDRLIEAADRRLNGEFDEEGMVRLLLVGLSCANPNCVERPSMRKVFQILSGEAEPIPVPKKKPLLIFCSSGSLSMKEIVSDGEETPPGLSQLTQIKID
ncbi:receptor lectin kinase [Rhynchospora pubera]|uniref:non-specific serine/threonine protein kinase n=1 Tax=Rhynchospora pubera TaxID=906938 RepID=A0AAV8D5J5_9POAL|nr:receptor lectin kinase [Rhynchospora pubera]